LFVILKTLKENFASTVLVELDYQNLLFKSIRKNVD